MPNEKHNQIAEAILANAHQAFYFGASNKGTAPHCNIQMKFIEEKINALKKKEDFVKKLEKFEFEKEKKEKIIETHATYIKTENIVFALKLLNFFYDYPELKKLFQAQMNKNWDDGWLHDLKDLKITWANAYLKAYQDRNKKILTDKDWELSRKLRLNGVPDHDVNKRRIYFKNTFFDIKAAALHGVAACEIMAEFALFDAIRMSKDLVCNIYYIRFLSKDYEEINAIVLGDWPKKDSLIVCPWLGEKGETIVWQGNLKDTSKFSHYSKVKTMYKISPGNEMSAYQKALETVDFITENDEKQAIRSKIENLSQVYFKAFDKFFIKKDAEVNSVPTRRLGR